MKILFVEPPKDFWFVMGEYLPPPLGILELASYLKSKDRNIDIEVIDCQAEGLGWKELEKKVETIHPDIIAPSALATCNIPIVLRTLEIAKKIDSNILTIVGGQHFTATTQGSLEIYPEIDVIVRREGEETLLELVQVKQKNESFSKVNGISFRNESKIIHTPDRPLINNLDTLPFPGYNFVKKNMKKYHFKMMAGSNSGYALIEASRGCPHHCSFCSQCYFWGGTWRSKSPKRIADEIEYCYREFGIKFFWLTDDNFGLGSITEGLCDELIDRKISDDIMWFMQARCDDIIKYKNILPKIQKAGNRWMLVGLESNSTETLETFNKKIDPSHSKEAMSLLKRNGIFAQATFIIGERHESHKSIKMLQDFVNDVDPDLAIFMILTPFPGTELYEVSKRNGWIEDNNWRNYDMIHAIMPTEKLSREEIQNELYECYRSFYGSLNRRFKSLFSTNPLKRKTYRYLASQGLLRALSDLF